MPSGRLSSPGCFRQSTPPVVLMTELTSGSSKLPRKDSKIRARAVRGYSDLTGDVKSKIVEQIGEQHARLANRLSEVGAIIVIASGKGGVGKSAVTANLAVALAARGARVGAVDADLNGPSLGKMLGLMGSQLEDRPDGVVPAAGVSGVRGISTDLLLEEGAPLRWKGPSHDQFVWQGVTEAVALREFISDVVWGPIDYLIIDIPPGTDKIGRFLDLVSEVGPSHLQPDQVLLVTIPSEVAGAVVARSATQLLEGGVPCIGLVGNMAGYVQPGGEGILPLFTGPSAREIAKAVGLELWAEIPFDPVLGSRTDQGNPVGGEGDSVVARVFSDLADRIEHGPGGRDEDK